MFKYDKATKNKYVGKRYKHTNLISAIYMFMNTFLITYDSCEKEFINGNIDGPS